MVNRYTDANYDEMREWYEAWNLKAPAIDMFPAYGLIAPNLAVGFLIRTDCKTGILDFYISNPRSNKYERDDALDEISRGLIQHARNTGLKYLKLDTKIANVETRALMHGFSFIDTLSVYSLKI